MKRVAIPVTNGKLSENFGMCSRYEVFEWEGTKVKRKVLELPEQREITLLPEWAANQGITDIITFKVEKRILSLFKKNKINFFIGVPVDDSESIFNEYRKGRLKSDERIIRQIMRQEDNANNEIQ
jgi:hypothetical protein